MIPIKSNKFNSELEIETRPSFTYKIKNEKDKIEDYINGIESIKQTVYKTLMTDRYAYEIYDFNYGVELNDLIGKSRELVKAEIPNRIKDALCVDDRIKDVYNFVFSDSYIDKNALEVKFNVRSIFGTEEFEWEVNI